MSETIVTHGAIEALADRLQAEQRYRLNIDYPDLFPIYVKQGKYQSEIHVGPKYTRIDFDGAGKLMIVNTTGEIFGIKAYGVIHRGHPYGTLATINDFDWSHYYPRRLRVTV